MTFIGQTDGNSRLASMHPAVFSNALSSNYRERYMMEMQASSHHGRSTFNRNGSMMSHYQQQLQSTKESSSSVWQQHQASDSDIKPHHHHVHSPEQKNMRGGGGGSSSRVPPNLLRSPDSMNRGSPASLQSSSRSSEQYDSTGTAVVRGGDLQQFVDFVDSGVRYTSLVPPTSASGNPLQQQHSNSGGGVNEGAMIRELIGRLGGSSMGSSNGDSLTPTSPIPSQCSAGGMENLAVVKLGGGKHGSWNSASAAAVEITSNVCGLAVDSSKGGVSVNGVAVGGLTTSHCLSPFSADPGFVERAARFSSFSNGNYAQPFPSTSECDGAAKMRSRSRAAVLSECSSKHLAGVTSNCSLVQESAAILNSGSSTPPELLLDSVIREVHSGRGVSYDIGLLASAADENHHDDNSAEANYGQVQGTPAVKLLSRTASNLLVAKKNHDEEEEDEETQGGTTTTTSADASSNPGKIRGISTSSVEQASSAGPREACPSSGGSSGVTNICVKKRKTSLDDRPPNKDLGSVSASSQGERDAKTIETEDAKAKRFRRGEGSKEKEEMRSKAERSSSETSGETSPRSSKDISKPSEPPKPDYIHVRARRGQATDSHSLAERVRREKISERMKFLQDLVPGCSKVTGKALMLDEIINYVQSLQRQVEFLSMKLASVNPRLDFNLETFLGKEVRRPDLFDAIRVQGTHPGGSQSTGLGSETSIPYPPMHPQQHQAQLQQGWDYQLHSETTLRRSMRLNVAVPVVLPARIDGFGDGVGQTSVWDDGELQSIVQMGLGHTPSSSSPASAGGTTPVPNFLFVSNMHRAPRFIGCFIMDLLREIHSGQETESGIITVSFGPASPLSLLSLHSTQLTHA